MGGGGGGGQKMTDNILLDKKDNIDSKLTITMMMMMMDESEERDTALPNPVDLAPRVGSTIQSTSAAELHVQQSLPIGSQCAKVDPQMDSVVTLTKSG